LGLLSGIRVLAVLEGLAGPLHVQLLAEQGADVVLVERPGQARTPSDLVRLRGCRSLAVDLEGTAGQALIARLTAHVDVLLLEAGVDGSVRLAAPPSEIAAANPKLVIARITGYGDAGPLAGAAVHDHLLAARTGLYNQPGWRPGPTFLTLPVPSIGAALLALQAIGSALLQRERTGSGQVVSTSLLAGSLANQPGIIWSDGQAVAGSPLARGPLGYMPLYRLYECADGEWVHLGCLSAQFQRRTIRLFGIESDVAALEARGLPVLEHQQAMIELVAAVIQREPFAVWSQRLEEADIPYARAQHTSDLLDDPQVLHQGLRISIDDPRLGELQQMSAVVALSGEAWPLPAPAPEAGQNTDAICAEVGLSPAEVAELRRHRVLA